MQFDRDLEVKIGRTDIYIHPEQFDHVITLDPPLPARPGCLIVECDLWRGWIWLGSTWRRKKRAGIRRIGFRRKVPYSRLIPEAITVKGIRVLHYLDADGSLKKTLDYHDAANPLVAMLVMGETRSFIGQATIESQSGEEYTSLLARVRAML